MTYKEVKNIVKEYGSIQRRMKLMRKDANFDQKKIDELTKRYNELGILGKYTYSHIDPSYFCSTGKGYLRLLHIAWSLLKGKTYDQIEQPKDENVLSENSWKIINGYKDQLENLIDKEVAA